MITRFYLVCFSSNATAPKLADVLGAATDVANSIGIAIASAVDLSLAMGKTSIGVEIAALADDHDRLLTAWRSRGLAIEDLSGEVRGLGNTLS
jgi:hypothetical protein